VARIEAAATTSGSNASSDANTNASTASAPTPPRRVSANTPGPSVSEPLASASCPVTPTVLPAGLAASSAARICSVGSCAVGDGLKR
jgi:hypothetical protein